MAVAGCINAYDCAGCYLTTLQQLQSDNIGVAINYTAPWEYWRRQLDYIKYTDKCGCTCCLTGENELRIVATQWVIKNFTLTNDYTNEVVNVKWNDLFGSNRAYTMVRYKTWSYPTSITDWTLAVKETTQNQYSVSWYNVNGLTDWTTYYFTAFAVSQDGTIIVMQSKTITAEFFRVKFQKVKYIQGAWWPYIKSWVYSTVWYRATIDFQITSTSVADQAVIWYYIDWQTTWGYRCWYWQNDWFTLSWWTSTTVRQTWTWSTITIANSSYQIMIFCKQRQANWSVDSIAYAKVFSCQIYDNSNVLIRDFVPAYRKSDNVIWLVDAVNKVFYTNAGSWSFTKGPDIN